LFVNFVKESYDFGNGAEVCNLKPATLHRNDHLRVTGRLLKHRGTELNWCDSGRAKVCHRAAFIVFITMRIAWCTRPHF